MVHHSPLTVQPDPFSILTRIETSATALAALGYGTQFTFQYPHSYRDLCNRDELPKDLRHCRFQYPHSDRDLCNRDELPKDLRHCRFQYPHSDRDLCNLVAPLFAQYGSHFQYPHSDRDLCNRDRLGNIRCMFIRFCRARSFVGLLSTSNFAYSRFLLYQMVEDFENRFLLKNGVDLRECERVNRGFGALFSA